MTDYALWGASPAGLPGGSVSFGAPTSLGVLFKVTAGSLYLKGYRYFCLDATDTTANVRFAAWHVTGTGTGTVLAGSQQTSNLTISATTPNDVFLTTPVALTSGQVYAAVVGDADHGPITNSYYTTGGTGAAGVTNGPLTAFSDQGAALAAPNGNPQGCFQQSSDDPAAAFPATGFSSSNFWISPIVTDDPAGFSVAFVSTDGSGVSTYTVAAQENNTGSAGAQPMRVLPPSSPPPAYAHAFLIMLGVDPGQGTTFGDSIGTIVSLGAHNTYNLTCIQPGYPFHPWYGDNPGDASTLQETFLLDLLTWIKANLAITGTEKVYLIGFSSSGLGGQGLQFRHPTVFEATASWDAPFLMTSYDGSDPDSGPVLGGPATVYGTNANFTANYELSTGNLAGWASPFTSRNRIWLGGFAAFQQDTIDYDARLTSAGILHTLGSMTAVSHAWHTAWVAEALANIIDVPPVVTVNAGLASGTGTAQAPATAVTVNAGVAAGTGVTRNSVVNTSGNLNIVAGVATGAGAALNAGVTAFTVGKLTASAAGSGGATITVRAGTN